MNSLNLDPAQLSGANRTESLKNSLKTSDNEKLMQSCRDFEAMFIKQMLDSMNATVDKSGLINESMGEKIWDDMLNDEYAQNMAKTSDFGIAEMMYKQLAADKYQ